MMSDLVPIADGMNGTPSRDALGRFTSGNRAAVGRSQPFATQAAALRRAFYEAVTPTDLWAMAHQLITQAKEGNLAATKLLLLWLLGKPGEAVNPDLPLPQPSLPSPTPPLQRGARPHGCRTSHRMTAACVNGKPWPSCCGRPAV